MSGNAYHDLRRTYADDIRDKDREKMKRYFEEHFYTIQQKYMAKK